jgi:glycosyltransferase involved in cell wall biosynthesis
MDSKIRILYTLANMDPPRGGGEKSAITLSERLSKDFDLTIITPSKKSFQKKVGKYKIIGIKKPFYFKFLKSFLKINFQNWWWKNILEEKIKKEKYDLLFSQGILIPSTINLPIKKIIFIRGAGFFAPNVELKDPKKCEKGFFNSLNPFFKIQYPLIKYYRKKSIKAIKKADKIISISDYIRKLTLFYTKRDSRILYSEIKKNDYKIKKSFFGEYYLFVAPTFSKGVDVMYKIAKSLPEKFFLVVGNSDFFGRKYYKMLKNLKNIKIIGNKEKMKDIYKKSKLLINPSKCYEGFGRTIVEAMINGIPSIVSGIGAMPEIVGNSGEVVKEITNIKEWLGSIKRYDNKKYYLNKYKKCLDRWKKFEKSYELQYNDFKNEIISLINKK